MKHNRLMVTAALPYANGPLHVGHIAGAYLPADMFCRYQRLKGRDIVFVCGSDEHGVPIMLRARAEKKTPKEIVDRYHTLIEDAFEKLGISFDYYGRTTSPVHTETSQDFFRKLAADHVFRIKEEQQLFDPEAGMFLADRFVVGTCPNCSYEEAYGDQCERCGTALSPTELINPRSTITQATPIMKSTTHWYMPLGDFETRLREWIDGHPEWKANVLGQVKSWLNEGLRDRAVTRDLPWGIPIPEEVAAEHGVDAAGKVLYVWFDAPIGYISATKEWAARKGDPELWRKYWQSDDSRLIHFIGKDNIVFHCLIFPSMMMAYGKYVLPDNVPANEFLNLEGEKLSTSRNWAIWVHEHLARFPADPFRYALATMLPESKDSDFSWSDYQARVNSELADVLGNFVHRTTSFVSRYFEGNVPPLDSPQGIDLDVLAKLAEGPSRIGAAYESFRFRDAVFETMALARLGNKYFNDTEPWRTIKTDPETCGNTLHVSLQICAALSVLLDPIVPAAAAQLRDILNLSDVRGSTPDTVESGSIGWDQAAASLLPNGHPIRTPKPLFAKMEDETIEAERAKLGVTEMGSAPNYQPLGETIEFDQFAKLDLRVATVISAEKVEGTEKLLRLMIDLGFERRQVVAGLAMHIDPQDLVKSRVVVVANLKPRKIRGLESKGMLLAAETPDGRLIPVTVEADEGSVVR